MRNIAINIILLIVHIPGLRNRLLRLLGFSLGPGAYIGANIVWGAKIVLAPGARVDSFNVIKDAGLALGEASTIGRFNRFWGCFDVNLAAVAHVGNFGIFQRGIAEAAGGRTVLSLGAASNITSGHYFDLSSDIRIGANSVVGGRSCQFWTHGFVHFKKGTVRLKKLKGIQIGEGVYVGASCILNPGTVIHDDINVGAGSVLAGEIREPGLYVNAKLRFIELGDYEEFSAARIIRAGRAGENPTLLD